MLLDKQRQKRTIDTNDLSSYDKKVKTIRIDDVEAISSLCKVLVIKKVKENQELWREEPRKRQENIYSSEMLPLGPWPGGRKSRNGKEELLQNILKVAKILHLIYLGFNFDHFFHAGDIIDDALAALLNIPEAIFKGADGLAESRSDFRQFFAAEY
jgi:hypothetical protein